MSSLNKASLGYITIFGMALGILHNYFYWSYLGVNYFSFVGFQEVFVSAVKPIVYVFLIFLVVAIVYFSIVQVIFNNGRSGSEASFLGLEKRSVIAVAVLSFFVLSSSAIILYYYESIYAYLYVGMFASVLVVSGLRRVLIFYGMLTRDLNLYEQYFLVMILSATVFVCFLGYRSAYEIENNELGWYFEENIEYGRYSGIVGEYFVFYRKSGDLYFLPRSSVDGFTLTKQ